MFPQGAWPCAAGATGRRPEGIEPARGAVDWREARSYTLDFCPAGRRLKTPVHTRAVYDLRPQVTDQIHPSHGKKSSWTPAGSTMSLQENPQVTLSDGFGEGWRVYSLSGMEVQAAGLSYQQGRAL